MTPQAVARQLSTLLRNHPDRWRQYYGPTHHAQCLVHHITRLAGPELYHTIRAFWLALDHADTQPMKRWNGLIHWNDTPGRTVNEVIRLCDRTASMTYEMPAEPIHE